jgi:hypothetical protein
MTLQALRQTVGSHAFFAVLRTWAREHRNGNGSTPQFIQLAERISGQELSPLFRAWLFTARKPAWPGTAPGTRSSAGPTRAGGVDAFVDQWQRGLEICLEHPSTFR